MEWTVVTVIVALVGLGGAIVKPIASLTGSITRLTVVVERIEGELEEQSRHSHESHRRLWEHNDGQDRQLQDHERRIGALEKE